MMNHFTGHIDLGNRITIYGDNAMHYAINIWTKRYGYICFRPTTRDRLNRKYKWKWYLYFSPNGTPQAATFAIGNVKEYNKRLAPIRKALWGHNFNTDEHRDELYVLNNYFEDWLEFQSTLEKIKNGRN